MVYNKVIRPVLDENRLLFFILIRFLHVFNKRNGNDNNAVAMIISTYKIIFQKLRFHREKFIHSYLVIRKFEIFPCPAFWQLYEVKVLLKPRSLNIAKNLEWTFLLHDCLILKIKFIHQI